MLFPISGVVVAPWVPPVVAFALSLLTSTGGVSGAFLLLPFQVSVLGFTSPAVSSTNQLYNIVAIPSGVWRYIREGRMVWPLTWVVVAGTLPGVLVGAILRVRYLPDPSRFKLFAGLVLLYIGGRLLLDLARGKGQTAAAAAEEGFRQLVREHRRQGGREEVARVTMQRVGLWRMGFEFNGQEFEFPTLGIFSLSCVVGMVGGVYGIGGGAIIAPFFVSVFGLPVYTVAGAALAGTFITSVAGVAFYQIIAPFYPQQAVAPDWWLGLLFGLGGAAGMYCGARLQKRVPARVIKGMLAIVVGWVAITYILGPLLR
jgi:uncharacterized membrane protein YfcA